MDCKYITEVWVIIIIFCLAGVSGIGCAVCYIERQYRSRPKANYRRSKHIFDKSDDSQKHMYDITELTEKIKQKTSAPKKIIDLSRIQAGSSFVQQLMLKDNKEPIYSVPVDRKIATNELFSSRSDIAESYAFNVM